MKLALLGPPGSGKGTVSEKVKKEFGLFHLSVGEVLREEAGRRTSLGRNIKKYINRGHLVPATLAVKLVKQQLGKKKNYLLDGFPRSLGQAQKIEDLNLDAVIYLDVPEKAMVERLSGRRLEPVTGKIYHLKYLPPPKKILKRLVQRKDDTPKVIKERFKVYHQETEPVIKYYQRKRILKKVDGAGSPEEVYQRVKKVIKELL